MVGALIRQLRMERNYSQAGLAHGICAASYLSKIEQGQAEPGPEILDRLFEALGVTYCRDEALLRQAWDQLERYLEARDQNEVEEQAACWLDAEAERLVYSDLNLWVGIYRTCRALDTPDCGAALKLLRQMAPMEAQMDEQQRYRYLLCTAEATSDPLQALDCVTQAARWHSCAHVYWARAYFYFHLGQYSRCMETAERAYSMAAEEGDLYVLMWASFLMGSCCTDRDLALAEKYYRRSIRLSRTAYPPLEHLAAYNLGASYLEWGKQEQALDWLERTEEIPGEETHNLLLHQKRALLYSALGRKTEGWEELRAAERILETGIQAEQENFVDMLCFARLILEEKQQTPEFETVTLRLCEQAGTKMGVGFRRFYSLYLVDVYRGQRRYKEALWLMEQIEFHKK